MGGHCDMNIEFNVTWQCDVKPSSEWAKLKWIKVLPSGQNQSCQHANSQAWLYFLETKQNQTTKQKKAPHISICLSLNAIHFPTLKKTPAFSLFFQ